MRPLIKVVEPILDSHGFDENLKREFFLFISSFYTLRSDVVKRKFRKYLSIEKVFIQT